MQWTCLNAKDLCDGFDFHKELMPSDSCFERERVRWT